MNIIEDIGNYLIKNNLKLATTESCTGGLLSSKLTDISGSSNYTALNLVTYSNETKEKMLGVVLNEEGAVSENCAFQMAKGLHKLTNADICISTTGIAGPTGGTETKPVGLMYSCIYTPQRHKIYKIVVDSSLNRIKIKEAFVTKVLVNLHDFLNINHTDEII